MGLIKSALALAECAARNWIADNASTTGASLAFFCAFSIAPLLVIVLTIAGLIVGAAAAYTQVGAQLDALFGPPTARVLLGAIESSKDVQGLAATVVSVVTLLIGATTGLAALETVLEQIWRSRPLVSTGEHDCCRSDSYWHWDFSCLCPSPFPRGFQRCKSALAPSIRR